MIFRRKAIYEELHPETKQHVAGAHGANKAMGNASENSALAFTASTADATGKSRRSVEIAAARGEALGDDLGAVTGTSLDKGVELDALAKMPKDERKGLIDRAKAGERVTARKELMERAKAGEVGFAKIEVGRSRTRAITPPLHYPPQKQKHG